MAPPLIHIVVQLVTILGLGVLKGPYLLISKLISLVITLTAISYLNGLDFILFLINLIAPRKRQGAVVAAGDPGYQGFWPEFQPPNPTLDSRSPCPYLNALANHGIINRNGRQITMEQLGPAICKSLNTSSTLAKNTTNGVEKLFGKSVIDLDDLSRHNVIEHDASAVRADAYFQPDQGAPSKNVINDLLSYASRPVSAEHPEGALSASDIAKFIKTRLADSKANNPTHTGLSAFHTLFMGNNLSLLLDTVDGDVRSLRTILSEEKFPDGFETSFRQRMGYTNLDMELRTAEILLRIQ